MTAQHLILISTSDARMKHLRIHM